MHGKQAAVAVALLMVTSVGVAGTQAATVETLTVCPSGCPYSSIQDAIDDAGEGDTILVKAGTYEEALHVDTPDLTIEGVGPSEVTVDATGFSGTRGVTAQADGFTLTGLTVLGPDDGSASSTDYGVKVEIDDEAAITDVALRNLVVAGSGKSEIDLHGVEKATLSHLTLQGQGTSGNGLAFTDSHDIHVLNVTTSGNTWGGIAFYTSGAFTGEALTSNITVVGYDDFTETNPVYLQGTPGTFQDIETEGFPVLLEYQNNEDFTFRQPSVEAALDAAPLFANSDRFDLGTATVEDTRDGSLHTTDGMSLALAVDQADAGDRVVAHGGTYGGSISVAADDVTVDGEDDAVITDTLKVRSDGVTLSDLHVKDAGLRGIVADGKIADLTLDTVTVSLTRNGLWVGGQSGVDGLTVTDGTVFRDNGVGLYTQNDPNFVDDVSTLGEVTDVTVEDTRFVDQERKGLYMETLSDAVFRNVTVDGVVSDTYGFNDGFDINLKAGTYSNITIRDSTVANVTEGEPFLGIDAFSAAIAIKARDDPTRYDEHPATLDGVTLDNVVVRDSFNGLRVGEPGVDYSTYDAPTDVTIHESTFVGNEGFAVQNQGQSLVDATHNWWGEPTGPSADGNPLTGTAPTGGTVEGPVDVTPWCLVPSCVANAAVHGVNPHPAGLP